MERLDIFCWQSFIRPRTLARCTKDWPSWLITVVILSVVSEGRENTHKSPIFTGLDLSIRSKSPVPNLGEMYSEGTSTPYKLRLG